ncbi:cell division protein FtsZ [Agarivorans sp. 1_MG-2023]|uniref:cell division protein FtsZ n=1 Tax=Agarivorans sp. 1_MG-2023 TaxID=3062634 RepID=UPI0026E1C52C|nr:cell division protein FtsZ [Agarivorans sp. 1_MG-2023]MDO6763917.1 cell division protein FtsZ [Agarivorans sp. 1_MG-2023]
MFEIMGQEGNTPTVSVIGVGGCGCNALALLEPGQNATIQLYNVNTDAAALAHCNQGESVLIGKELTNGYGAGADPDVGKQAAEESKSTLRAIIESADVVLLTTGLGGGTGTGSTPVLAKLADELGKPCIVVATLPFASEGQMRTNYAQQGIERMYETECSLVTFPNDNLIQALGATVGIFDAFTHSNDMLKRIITSLVQMLTDIGYLNIDLNDFSKVMRSPGEAVLGIGHCEEEEHIDTALEQALFNPLVNNVDLNTATGVIIQVNCREQITLGNWERLTGNIRDKVSPLAIIVCGIASVPDQQYGVEILVMATGAQRSHKHESRANTAPATQSEVEHVESQELSSDNILDIPTFLCEQSGKAD